MAVTSLLRFSVRAAAALASRWRNLYYRSLGVRIRGYAWLRAIEIPRNWSGVTLEGPVALDSGVTLLVSGTEAPDTIVIRSGTYINRQTMLDAHRRIEIGRNCMIGPYCYLTDANHGTEPGMQVSRQAMEVAAVVLGEDVWLGAGVAVLAGVRIGDGTVVGAGSVITKDLPPNVVAAGVPARVLRLRGPSDPVPDRDDLPDFRKGG